ncbi:hypothetical protein AAUPMB_10461 [Pasteurella multocida subsp. multocida str. Anand1_buffalo]|nr:hypothetical protein AAUPMB_10461 [Pasteurella multocida subsp. multocida str. Anand1_buffalo]
MYHPKKAYSGHIALNSHYAITDHIGMGLSFPGKLILKR